MANSRALDLVSFDAGADLSGEKAGTLLTLNDDGDVVKNTTAGGYCVGALGSVPKFGKGDAVQVATFRSQRLRLIAGAAVAKGEFVVSNAAGKAVKAAGTPKVLVGVTGKTHIVAKAVEDAAQNAEFSAVGVDLLAGA